MSKCPVCAATFEAQQTYFDHLDREHGYRTAPTRPRIDLARLAVWSAVVGVAASAFFVLH